MTIRLIIPVLACILLFAFSLRRHIDRQESVETKLAQDLLTGIKLLDDHSENGLMQKGASRH